MTSASAEKALQGIPTRWPLASLGTLLTFLTSGSRGWAAYYATEGDLFLRIQNVSRNKLLLDDIAFVRAPDTAEARRTQVQAGDVLLSITADLGRTAVIPERMNRAFINQHLALLRLHNDVDPYFVSAFLASPAGQVQIGGLNRQGVKAGLNFDDIRSIYIPLPPLPEQRRIAAILDKADAIRRKQQRVIARMEDFLRSVFLDMFGDPVTNPKGWPLRKLGDICEARLGKMLDSKKQTGKFLRPYLRNTNVQWGRFNLEEVFEMDFDDREQIEFRLLSGDVLVCEGGAVGRAAIWNGEIEECYFQKALHRLRPNLELVTSQYIAILMYFLAHNSGLTDHTTSATIAHLTGIKLKNIDIPLPPLNLQQKYVGIEEEYKSVEPKNMRVSKEIQYLFDSLTHLAFRGELTDRAAKEIFQQAAAS